jgi:uncharacterized membrane protein (DUF485 family)
MITIASNQLMINYAVIFLAGFGVWLFLLKGYAQAWLSVRFSGGSKILVNVNNPLGNYFRAGKVDNGFLYYTARRRKDNPDPARMLYVGSIAQYTYRANGVNNVDVDDLKSCVWSRYGTSSVSDKGTSSNYEAVSTNNAEAYDEAQYTALHKPSTKKAMFDEYTWQIIILIAVILFAVGIALIYSKINTLDSHLKLTYDTVTTLNNVLTNSTLAVS